MARTSPPERKARAGLSRTIKLRIYPSEEQAGRINRTIGTIRFVWNTIWLPMLQAAEHARAEHAERLGGTKEAWKEAWRLGERRVARPFHPGTIKAMLEGPAPAPGDA